MAYVGNGSSNDNFLQWDDTKNAWQSTAEAAYVHLNTLTSAGVAVSIPAASLDWAALAPTWVFAKGSSIWQVGANGIELIGVPTPYINKWLELEVKADVYQSGAGFAANSTIALAVAQGSDGVAGTAAFPKFEQRVFLPGAATPSEWVQCSFKNAIQYTHTGIKIYTRMLNSHGGTNINFVTAQLTIKPL
jgi:hypothetical protein